MDYAKMRVEVLEALSAIAFGTDDLPAGAQHRIKALDTLFGLLALAKKADEDDVYFAAKDEKKRLEQICEACLCEDESECVCCPYSFAP